MSRKQLRATNGSSTQPEIPVSGGGLNLAPKQNVYKFNENERHTKLQNIKMNLN